MSGPHEFRLQLKKSAIKYKLKSLERFRGWFPSADVEFEIKSNGKTFRTYVDRANRLRLHDWLIGNPEAEAGDYLVFTPLLEGRQWRVRLEKRAGGKQTTLITPSKMSKEPRRRVRRFGHTELQDMLISLSEHFGMFPSKEYKYEHYIYDVIWRRVRAGNPVKVFEVQVGGKLDSALSKLKHARDTWNSDLFLVVTSSKDMEKAEYLLEGSFHEIKDKLTILMGSELYDMLNYKDRYSQIEKQLQK